MNLHSMKKPPPIIEFKYNRNHDRLGRFSSGGGGASGGGTIQKEKIKEKLSTVAGSVHQSGYSMPDSTTDTGTLIGRQPWGFVAGGNPKIAAQREADRQISIRQVTEQIALGRRDIAIRRRAAALGIDVPSLSNSERQRLALARGLPAPSQPPAPQPAPQPPTQQPQLPQPSTPAEIDARVLSRTKQVIENNAQINNTMLPTPQQIANEALAAKAIMGAGVQHGKLVIHAVTDDQAELNVRAAVSKQLAGNPDAFAPTANGVTVNGQPLRHELGRVNAATGGFTDVPSNLHDRVLLSARRGLQVEVADWKRNADKPANLPDQARSIGDSAAGHLTKNPMLSGVEHTTVVVRNSAGVMQAVSSITPYPGNQGAGTNVYVNLLGGNPHGKGGGTAVIYTAAKMALADGDPASKVTLSPLSNAISFYRSLGMTGGVGGMTLSRENAQRLVDKIDRKHAQEEEAENTGKSIKAETNEEIDAWYANLIELESTYGCNCTDAILAPPVPMDEFKYNRNHDRLGRFTTSGGGGGGSAGGMGGGSGQAVQVGGAGSVQTEEIRDLYFRQRNQNSQEWMLGVRRSLVGAQGIADGEMNAVPSSKLSKTVAQNLIKRAILHGGEQGLLPKSSVRRLDTTGDLGLQQIDRLQLHGHANQNPLVQVENHPVAKNVALFVAEELGRLKAAGFEMPHTVIIRTVGDPASLQAGIHASTKTIVGSTQVNAILTVNIPYNIPHNLNVNQIVAARFTQSGNTTIRSIGDLVTHEMGHVVHVDRPYTRASSATTPNDDLMHPKQKAIAQEVSNYAMGSKGEFVAETFVKIVRNKTSGGIEPMPSAAVMAQYDLFGGPKIPAGSNLGTYGNRYTTGASAP